MSMAITSEYFRRLERNNSGERRGRKRQMARTRGAHSEPKWRGDLRDPCVYTSAGRTCSSSDHLWHRVKGCPDVLRPKSVSTWRLHRDHVSWQSERKLAGRNN